jgi:glycosyltransferase involved in cell wall biosynthesis
MIAFICPFSEASASASRIINLSLLFRNKKIILPKHDKYGQSFESPDYYFPLVRKSFWLLPVWWAKTIHCLIKLRPKAVVFQKPHLFTLPPALACRILHKNKLVFDCDEWDPATLGDNKAPAWEIAITCALAKIAICHCDLIIHSNQHIKKEKIPEKHWGKAVHIPNGVDTEKFRPHPGQGFHLMYVGTLYKLRHIIGLVDAVKLAVEKDDRIMCTIVGGGDRLGELKDIIREKQLNDHFTFTGPVSHEILPDLMDNADIMLAPFEDLPGIRYQSNVKVFEYMASGKPTIASRVGELEEVLDKGQAGLLVEPGNPRELADAITCLSSNPHKAGQMGRAAREKAVREYGWGVLAARLKKALDAIL